MKVSKRGFTFNDVLLIPKKSVLKSRAEAGTKTQFTKRIFLNIPLVSSNMATVTEHKMAIAMAREGGLGVIHQFCSIQEQTNEIRKVKKSTSYVIENPISVTPEISVREATHIMKKEDVTSLLIAIDRKIIGIFTRRDYLFEKNLDKKISEVMTPIESLITAPYGISADEAKQILHANRIEKLPLVAEDGTIRGLITTQDLVKIEYWGNAARDKKGRLMVAGAVGVKDTLERAAALVNAGADCLVLDIAHAHSDYFIEKLRELKFTFNIDVMAGNIATADAARDLIAAGADGLKVGIGPSPVCTTRIISGSGVPQLTAILEVAEVAKNSGIPVSADGGMKYPGDCVKALAAGASTIYSGSFFAGTDESPGMILMKDGKRYKRYIGSASYDSGHERKEKEEGKEIREKMDIFVEGVSNLVDYKGPVEEVIKGLVKGIKSGMSYAGARNIPELHECSEFIEITPSGWEESLSRGQKVSE